MHISFFFANDLLLAVYILYMEMMLGKKKQIRAIFLFEFKMGSKAAKTTQYEPCIEPRNC